MQKIIKIKLKIAAIILLVLCVFSCSKEELNLNSLDETIFVRHKKADMPAYIHGNASEKVFLIILHGGPGGNGLWYRVNTIRTEIEKNNAVVYFDQRGHNNSQGNYSEKEVNIDLMAEDVVALAQVIKEKFGNDSKVFLMGHSWGGTLGSAALLKNQEEFSGWIDVAGAHDLKGIYDKNKIVLNTIANEQIGVENSVEHWKNVLELVASTGPINTSEDSGKLNGASHEGEIILEEDKIINEEKMNYDDDDLSDNFRKVSWSTNKIRDILVRKQGIFQNVSYTDRLIEITVPAIVLWGKYDLVVPTSFAQEAFDNLGSSDKEIFIFKKSAHDLMLTEPDFFAEKVIEFINSH